MNLMTHNGTWTLVSSKTGDHRTVKVTTIKAGTSEYATRFAGKRKVSLLVGQNNENDYQQFGWVEENGNIRLCQKSQTPFYSTLADIVAHPEKWAGKVEYKVEGCCIKCNRKLTHPASIDAGIGPECSKQE
jgi:hypothetical protein